MAASQSDESDYSVGRFLWMIGNALHWKCPTCGERPLFVPWHKVRSLADWFMPLDGCPKCGYPYEREPGYFLLSIFAINYGVAALLGVIVYLVLDFWVRLPIGITLLLTILPIPLFNLWFARHSKALFMAFDLFFDPHHRDSGDGDQPVTEPGHVPKDPSSQPVRR
jgi:predicted RNA-binding Zn-ribbon protein involved in translation (DUF1610 family)